ncbi:MAG: EF-Tu/IF-2/RF-3 family GTPase, partial [bacterium]
MVESIVETEETLTMKYLDGEDISAQELAAALKTGIINDQIIPLVSGSSTKNIGLSQFLDFAVDYLPDPGSCGEITARQDSDEIKIKLDDNEKFSAYVFKIVSEQNLGELAFFRIYSGTLAQGADVYNSTKNSFERVGQLVIMRGKTREELSALHAGDIGAVAKLKNTSM